MASGDVDDQLLDSSDSFESQIDTERDYSDEPSASTDDGDFDLPSELEQDRAARRRRHVRMFCFSCNRYEGHSIAARNRTLYSYLVGFTFGLYYYLGRYSCHCCGSVRLARYDWLNVRYWYRTVWLGGIVTTKKSSSKSRSRR